MTAKASFQQADVTRALKGFTKAGLAVGGIRIAPDGEIVIFSSDYAESLAQTLTANPLDEVLLNAPQGKAAR